MYNGDDKVIVTVAVILSVASSSQRDSDNGNASYYVADEWYKVSGIKMWYWGDCGASSKCQSTKMACPMREWGAGAGLVRYGMYRVMTPSLDLRRFWEGCELL